MFLLRYRIDRYVICNLLHCCVVTVWDDCDVKLLIETYRSKQHAFRNPMTKKKHIWNDIAADMNHVKGQTKFTGVLCDKKWHNLEDRFKTIVDKKSKTGRSGGKIWKFFDDMDELVGKSASVMAISEKEILSDGKGDTDLKTKTKHMISPPSDSSDDEVHDQAASASVMAKSSKTVKQRKRIGSEPPQWFSKFAESHDKQQEAWRTELRDFMQRQEQLQNQRMLVCKDMVDLMREIVRSNES